MSDGDMVEAVARAIYKAVTPPESRWECVEPVYQEGVWRAYARAALSVLEPRIEAQEREQGWQDIATLREASLPDGELVLVAGFWTSGEPWRAIGAAWADGMVSGDWNDIDGPTHWRHLPEPPAIRSGDAG